MFKLFMCIASFVFLTTLISCSKKTHPSRTSVATNDHNNTKVVVENEPIVTKKVISKPKAVFPKIISVNDSAARKSVDGRYYYDVLGHRYWRNNKDGKYYLFSKSMYKNDDFKPEQSK